MRRFSPHLLLGSRGERAAARHLRRRGCRILARNYRCPAGEVDIIAAERDMLLFVEVKTRASDAVQDPFEAVRGQQRRRVISAARYFLSRRRAQDIPSRFDVITVVWPRGGKPVIEQFEDAFGPGRA